MKARIKQVLCKTPYKGWAVILHNVEHQTCIYTATVSAKWYGNEKRGEDCWEGWALIAHPPRKRPLNAVPLGDYKALMVTAAQVAWETFPGVTRFSLS